jgi:hypothetical protein
VCVEHGTVHVTSQSVSEQTYDDFKSGMARAGGIHVSFVPVHVIRLEMCEIDGQKRGKVSRKLTEMLPRRISGAAKQGEGRQWCG